MRKPLSSALFIVLSIASAFAVAGCDDEPAASSAPPPRRPAASASASAAVSAAPTASNMRVFGPEDFSPSDRNRDPFRGYPEKFIAKRGDDVRATIRAVADHASLDELKLVAIVSGGTQPRAMFVDPQGKGWIVTVGQRVGRSEIVRSTSANGPEYDVNWKVDRIREDNVVFVRDTTSGNIPSSTRVIALRPEGGDEPRKR